MGRFNVGDEVTILLREGRRGVVTGFDREYVTVIEGNYPPGSDHERWSANSAGWYEASLRHVSAFRVEAAYLTRAEAVALASKLLQFATQEGTK